VEKIAPKVVLHLSFKKLPKVNNRPKGETSSQSGHADVVIASSANVVVAASAAATRVLFKTLLIRY
jgi:hypothetical protein